MVMVMLGFGEKQYILKPPVLCSCADVLEALQAVNGCMHSVRNRIIHASAVELFLTLAAHCCCLTADRHALRTVWEEYVVWQSWSDYSYRRLIVLKR
jgi:hypothetical protein